MTFIPKLKNDDHSISLKKIAFDNDICFSLSDKTSDISFVAILDLETTGLDFKVDKIIEIAVKIIAVNDNGYNLGVVEHYESFDDPKIMMTKDVINVHGITNEMVSGKSVDWQKVSQLLKVSDYIVAHNAQFDRSFLDLKLEISSEKIWGCSLNDIDWSRLGFNSKNQELLCIWHGFYYESHRAMNDVEALINLLTHKSYKKRTPLKMIIENINEPEFKIVANNSPFEAKRILKSNGYIWNPMSKVWYKKVRLENIEKEKDWLSMYVYYDVFKGDVIKIEMKDRYKL